MTSKDIAVRIREESPAFSKSQNKIANIILTGCEKAAYMTAAELSTLCGVSESTIVRFAIRLGYEGYPEMQRAIQELVRTKLTPHQRIEVMSQRFAGGDLLSGVLNADIARIRYTLDNVDRDAFRATVEAMLGAKNIYIFGARSSATLAYFLNFNLQLIQDNIRMIQPSSSSEVFEQILSIKEGDLLFAISFPRYSKKVINAVKFAREQGAQVVALTDSQHSPLAGYANHLLTAQSDMVSFVDSLVAPLSVLNAVLAAIAQQTQDGIVARFDKLEHVWDEYDVYEKH